MVQSGGLNNGELNDNCTGRNKRVMLMPAQVLHMIPDISDSSRTVHKFVQVVHVPAISRLVGRSTNF